MPKKFVAALNEKYEAGALLSALGHCSAGMAANSSDLGADDFVDYKDGEGQTYPNISSWPFIVLGGKGSHLKRLRDDLIANNIPYSAYLDTMISGGSDAQVAATLEKTSADLEILALVCFGEADVLNPLTKRLSLWKK